LVAPGDLAGLRARLLVAAAHDSGRLDVELEEVQARLDVVRIELDGPFERPFDLGRYRGLPEEIPAGRYETETPAQPLVLLGASRIELGRLLEPGAGRLEIVLGHERAAQVVRGARVARIVPHGLPEGGAGLREAALVEEADPVLRL